MSTQKNGAARWQYKLGLLVFFSLAYFLFYVYPNFHPFVEVRELPLLAIDRSVPFLSWSFVVYLSEFLLIALTIILIKDLQTFNSFTRLAFGMLIFVGTIFMFFPTSYPRPDYPPGENVVVAFAMNLIADADMPTNCFPSLHVAITSIAVFSLRFLKRKYFVLFVIWGLAIFASTLTTKQHYFVDILGGFALAVIAAIFESRAFPRAL